MGKDVNYTLVGVFVIVLLITLITIFSWLFMKAGRENYKPYIVYMKADVTGLTEDSPVRYNGVKVGYVKSVTLDKRNPRRVKIRLNIIEGTPINTSTVATAMPQGITGILYINLHSKKQKAPPLHSKPGHHIPVIPSKPSLFAQIGKVIPEVAKRTEQVMRDIHDLLNKGNRKTINHILVNMETASDALARNEQRFDTIVHNTDRAMLRLRTASESLPELTNNAEQAMTQFRKTSALAETMMTHAKQAMGQFSDQIVPDAQQFVRQLNATMGHINHFAREIEAHPSVLVRGKTSEPRGPGE